MSGDHADGAAVLGSAGDEAYGVVDIGDLTDCLLAAVRAEKLDGLRLLVASEQAYSKVELAQRLPFC